jgi:hypothetical protein
MLGSYSTFLFTDEVIRVINNYQDGDAPMFLCLRRLIAIWWVKQR